MCISFIMFSFKVFLISNYSSKPNIFLTCNSYFTIYTVAHLYQIITNIDSNLFIIGGIPPRSKWKSQNQNVWRCFTKSSVDTYCSSLCYLESSVHTWSEGVEKRDSSKDCLGKLSFNICKTNFLINLYIW